MNRFEATWLAQIHARKDAIEKTRVLVACSGGGDSTALLLFLYAVRNTLGLDLIVAHADHRLREDSSDDAAFVGNLCRERDLDLLEASLDVERHAHATGQGLETAARELRWAWLKAEAASCGASIIATGHTLDDHTETVWMRLGRGSGAGCLTPLPAIQPPRWSPLIQARRSELRAYLRMRGIAWREDPTNQQDFTSRNRWRKLLDLMRTEAPHLDAHLWETHLQVQALKQFQETLVLSWRGSRWVTCPEGDGLVLRGTWTEPELHWVLERAFRELGWKREANLLRGLASWIQPLTWKKSRKPKSWGGWTVRFEPSGGALHPICRVSPPSPGRLEARADPQEAT